MGKKKTGKSRHSKKTNTAFRKTLRNRSRKQKGGGCMVPINERGLWLNSYSETTMDNYLSDKLKWCSNFVDSFMNIYKTYKNKEKKTRGENRILKQMNIFITNEQNANIIQAKYPEPFENFYKNIGVDNPLKPTLSQEPVPSAYTTQEPVPSAYTTQEPEPEPEPYTIPAPEPILQPEPKLQPEPYTTPAPTQGSSSFKFTSKPKSISLPSGAPVRTSTMPQPTRMSVLLGLERRRGVIGGT